METLIASMVLMLEFITYDLSRTDPMTHQVNLELPEKAYCVGQAAQHYADTIGYQLLQGFDETLESDLIACRPIQAHYPSNTCLPVEEAILGLVDGPCQLVVDHHYKIFAFRRVSEQ